MPRERSRARPRNSGLLTVRHACASECFSRKTGSTVCETLLNMSELISWSFFGGQSFCCFHADLLFFTSSTLCADRRRRRIRRHRTTSESHRAKWLQPHPKYVYYTSPPIRGTLRIPKKRGRGKNSWIPYMSLTTVERHTIVAPIGTATSAAQNQDTTSVQCPLGSSRLLFARVTFSAPSVPHQLHYPRHGRP